ncbi:MAG: hypothetical protein U9R56_05875, partial [candidate division Zixibacteria bacterium]|nr:hypothetical protein [candidate division Zixibacteria bacterium]
MLKRLIFAVFVLGLFLTLSGTAISDTGIKEGLNPVQKIDPTHERFGLAESCLPAQPTFKKPETALIEVEMGGVAPIPPVGYFCDYQGYYDPAVTTVYVWTIPDAYGDDLFNTRFTVDAGLLACTLKVGWILMYGGYMEGTPDMRIYLWDDDGYGFPGNKLDSVDIPYASLPTGGFGWVGADWTNGPELDGDWVFFENEEYHIGWTTLGDGVNDILCGVSDQATGPHDGEERSSEFYGGMWGSMLNDWGIDVVFLMESERCCSEVPYSDCYSLMYASNLAYIWRAPHPTYGDEVYSMRFTSFGPDTLVSADIAVYDDGTGNCGNDDIYATLYADDGTGLPGAQLAPPVTVPAGSYGFYPTWTNFDFGNIVMDGSDFHIGFSSAAVFGSGDYEVCISSDGSDGTGRSASDWGGGYWVDMLNGWGLDCNFLIQANLCKDPYNVCSNNYYYTGPAYFWNLPDAYGDVANAQKIKAIGEDCHIENVSWALYSFGGATQYTYNSKVSIYTDVSGLPGSEIASVTLTPADYVLFPGMTSVDFTPLDVYAVGAYWVAIESFAPTQDDGIATLTD